MSSVTMAADSTQADFIRHRVRPAVKATERGRGERHLMLRDRSRSRHQSSSRSHKQKRNKEFSVKSRRRIGSHTPDDSSNHDSDLDLSKDLLPISGYVRIKDEMVDHMFRSISSRKLRAMLPEILKPLSTGELKRLCVEQLEVMSKKRICRILNGADPETISSSGTEEDDDDDDDDEEDEDESKFMADADCGGDGLKNTYTENEAVDSTSLHATDDSLPKRSSASHLAEDDDDKNEHPYNTSCERDELTAATDDGKQENDDQDREMNKVPETPLSGDENSDFTKISKLSSREMETEEDYRLSVKVNEGKYSTENNADNTDPHNAFGREENTKMNKRCMERVYRAKQLDDDDSNGEGHGGKDDKWQSQKGTETEKSLDDGLLRDQSRKEDDMSDSDSIPSSLPGLESEPEETCCPFVIVDAAERALKTVGKASEDVSSSINNFSDGSPAKQANITVQECTGHSSVGSDRQISDGGKSNEDEKGKQLGMPTHSLLQSSSKLAESGNEGEEMIIEIHDHEFSDDVDDEDDFRGESQSKSKVIDRKTKVDEQKESLASKRRTGLIKEVSGTEEQQNDEETQKHQKEMNLKMQEATNKMDYLGRDKVRDDEREIEQRGMKRKGNAEKDDDDDRVVGDTKTNKVSCVSDTRVASVGEQKKVAGIRADGKSNLASQGDSEAGSGSSERFSVTISNRSEDASSQFQAETPIKRDTIKLTSASAGQNSSQTSSDVMKTSKPDDASDRKNPPIKSAANNQSSAGVKAEKSETHISSSQSDSSYGKDIGHSSPSKTNQSSSHQRSSAVDCPSSTETNKESAPVLSKTQLEILELEMRARAIKAMLKAQEELEKREEKLKLEEKCHSAPTTNQVQRSSVSTESRKVIIEESKTARLGSSYKGTAPVDGLKTTPGRGVDTVRRVIQREPVVQQRDNRVVERRPRMSIGEQPVHATQSSRLPVKRPAFKSSREVMTLNRFQGSTYRLMKKPVALASRGRGTGGGGVGSSSSINVRRIVQLSGGPRTDSRTVVSGSKMAATRPLTASDKSTKTTFSDVRRVVASTRGNPAFKLSSNNDRYGHRDREQKRAVVAWNRRDDYKQRASKSGRF